MPCRKPPLPTQASLRPGHKRPSLAPADTGPVSGARAGSATAAPASTAAGPAAIPSGRKAAVASGSAAPRPRVHVRRTQPAAAAAATASGHPRQATQADATQQRKAASAVPKPAAPASSNPVDSSTAPQQQRNADACPTDPDELSSMLAGLSTSSSFSFTAPRTGGSSSSTAGAHIRQHACDLASDSLGTVTSQA